MKSWRSDYKSVVLGVIGNAIWTVISRYIPLLKGTIAIPIWVLASIAVAIVTLALFLLSNFRQAKKSPPSPQADIAPKAKLIALDPRISYVNGHELFALLRIQNNSTDIRGHADRVISRLRFWDVQGRHSTYISYGIWNGEAGATETTIAPGDTKEIILTAFEKDGSAVAVDVSRRTVVDSLASEIKLGFGEWLVDVEVIGTGFHKQLPRVQLFLKPGEAPSIGWFFTPLKALGTEHPRYKSIPEWPEH